MKYDLSILIPSRNEEFLARTVADIVKVAIVAPLIVPPSLPSHTQLSPVMMTLMHWPMDRKTSTVSEPVTPNFVPPPQKPS